MFSPVIMIAIALHALSCLLVLVALISGSIWLARFANKETLKQIFWSSVVLGLIGSALTAPLAMKGFHNMMDWKEGRFEMMNWSSETPAIR